MNLAHIPHIAGLGYICDGDSIDLLASLIDDIHRDFVASANTVFSRLDVHIRIACFDRSFQLSYIDRIRIRGACRDILNSTIAIECDIVDGDISPSKSDTPVAGSGNGSDSFQGFVQRQTVRIDYQIFLSIFELHVDLLIADRNTLSRAQSCVCDLALHILYIRDRIVLRCIYIGDISVLCCDAGQACKLFLQLDFHILAIVAHADIVIAREVHGIAGCDLGRNSAIGGNVPTFGCLCLCVFCLAVHLFQLRHIHGIGIFTARSNACDLTCDIPCCIPDRNSALGRHPDGLVIFWYIRRSKSACPANCSICYRTCADRHTAFCLDCSSISNGDGVIRFDLVFISQRNDIAAVL